jgi:hypothetical protein
MPLHVSFSLIVFLYAHICCAQLSEKESRLADVQSRLGMLLERSRLAEERAASSELRLQCIQDKIDSKVKDNAAMEQRRKDNLGAWLLANDIVCSFLTLQLSLCRK